MRCLEKELVRRPSSNYVAFLMSFSIILELELFTDVFSVEFVKLHEARKAKKQLDAKSFYGGTLHISYALENESVADCRSKLLQRQKEVKFRLKSKETNNTGTNKKSLDDCVDQYISSHKRAKPS